MKAELILWASLLLLLLSGAFAHRSAIERAEIRSPTENVVRLPMPPAHPAVPPHFPASDESPI